MCETILHADASESHVVKKNRIKAEIISIAFRHTESEMPHKNI